ncbi:hypothetical protein [Leptolyngbya sp. GGD]|uniref:hypothetical protein n=1 Tax=Leptolyngbya sp. GGD TaxID=2997907 RepID=UPI00227AA927|nr:hypothetical protein [Leptolyngbya sp. GGD]MCY6493553.1 hypothetical protein [Leptolyngbya sp. GGD]
MSDIYLVLFIVACIACVSWGLDRMSRVYQYPFFMGGIFAAFLVPQALSLYLTKKLPSETALERVLLMSFLCATASFLSAWLPAPKKPIRLLQQSLSDKKLFQIGLILAAAGLIFSRWASGTEATVNNRGQLTGLRTILSTFTYLSLPGLSILLSLCLKCPTMSRLVATLFAALGPLQRVVFYGRREVIASLLLTVALTLFFHRGWKPPRSLVVGGVVFALLAIPLAGEYRRISSSGDWSQLWNLDPVGTLQADISNAKDLELEWAALQMDAAVKTGQYGYGVGYWNELVFRFIPGQLVGRDFKSSLMIETQSFNLKKLYDGFVVNPGLVPTGVCDSFLEFDYFGCLVFLALGYLYKVLWTSATRDNSFVAQLLYVSFIPSALKGVTHGTRTCLADMTFYLIFLGIAVLYARKRVRTSQSIATTS